MVGHVKTLAVHQTGAASARLRSLIEELHPTALPRVGHRMRAWSSRQSPFDELTAGEVTRLLASCVDITASACAFSLHRDGRVREVAVAHLAASKDRVALPFLLLRCGDWVDVVRRSARSGIDQWLTIEHLDTWLRSVPLLAGARFSHGRPAADLPGRVAELYELPDAEPILLRHVTNPDAVARRTATRLLLERGPSIELLERAVDSDDPVVIGLAARDLPTDGEVNTQAGRLLVKQRSPRLRQEGLYRLLKADGADAEMLARTAMLDHAGTVRTTAQRWFAARGGDVAAYYRSLAPQHRREALLGLGDQPSTEDAEIARESLSGPAGTRRAALRLLARLALQEDRQLFTNCLLDGSEREASEAVAWFSRTGIDNDSVASVWARAQREPAAVRVLLRLAPLAHGWTRLDLALRASTDPRPAVRDTAIVVLQRALNQPSGFRTASPQRRAELRRLLERAEHHLPTAPSKFGQPSLTDRLRHLLRSDERARLTLEESSGAGAADPE